MDPAGLEFRLFRAERCVCFQIESALRGVGVGTSAALGLVHLRGVWAALVAGRAGWPLGRDATIVSKDH